MKEIERYIQFAIDNGYSLLYFPYEKWHLENYPFVTLYIHSDESFKAPDMIDITKIITSKEFIEAIARGLEDDRNRYILPTSKYSYSDIGDFKEAVRVITLEQAIAIRDGKLDAFITNLLPK